ncbi:MAG: MbcA/ParS/Xre antitoxin family protein [Pseudomonadota bacterium]
MSTQVLNLPANAAQAAVGTVLNILDKWSCSEKEKMALLGIGRSTLHKYQAAPASARLSADLLERISYLLNIHAVLRILFENPENVYGFVRLPNNNPFFNGKAPIEILSTGLMSALYEVHRHLDALRDGQFA